MLDGIRTLEGPRYARKMHLRPFKKYKILIINRLGIILTRVQLPPAPPKFLVDGHQSLIRSPESPHGASPAGFLCPQFIPRNLKLTHQIQALPFRRSFFFASAARRFYVNVPPAQLPGRLILPCPPITQPTTANHGMCVDYPGLSEALPALRKIPLRNQANGQFRAVENS